MNAPAPISGAHFDVIVVGAGYGGVSSAAVLASRGLRVLVVDKNAKPGGKAMPAKRSDGIVTELWPVAGGPTYGSRFDDLIALLDMPRDTIIGPNPGAEFVYIDERDKLHCARVSSQPIRNPLSLFKLAATFGATPMGLLGLLHMNIKSALLQEDALQEMDNMSMAEWLQRFALPKSTYYWLTSLMNLFFVVPVDELPASEAILTLRDVATGGAGRYHRGGYWSVAEAAVRYVENHGGSWLPSTRVKKVLVEDGQAVGIETARNRYFAPVIISNAGIQPTVLKLVGNKHFPPGYVRRVKELKPSWALAGVRYDLSKAFFDVPMNVYFSKDSGWDKKRFAAAESGNWPRNPLLFVTVPSLYDPQLATKDTPQVALISILCSPDPASPMNEQAIIQLEDMVDRLWPELRKHVIRRKTYGAGAVSSTTRDNVINQGGECIGLGQMIGQCGGSKPDIRSPLQGLYFVGTDAGGRGIGTTQAVDSGFNVAKGILDDLQRGIWQQVKDKMPSEQSA